MLMIFISYMAHIEQPPNNLVIRSLYIDNFCVSISHHRAYLRGGFCNVDYFRINNG